MNQHINKLANAVGFNAMGAQTPFLENYITIKDLSQWLQVPEKTIRDWTYKRQIPYQKIGKHVRFVPSAINSWLQENGGSDGNRNS